MGVRGARPASPRQPLARRHGRAGQDGCDFDSVVPRPRGWCGGGSRASTACCRRGRRCSPRRHGSRGKRVPRSELLAPASLAGPPGHPPPTRARQATRLPPGWQCCPPPAHEASLGEAGPDRGGCRAPAPAEPCPSLPSELPGVQPQGPGVHRARPAEQETGRREVRALRGGRGGRHLRPGGGHVPRLLTGSAVSSAARECPDVAVLHQVPGSPGRGVLSCSLETAGTAPRASRAWARP